MTAGTSWQSCFCVFYLQNILAVSGLPSPSAGDLPSPGIEPRSLAWQADPLPSESWGKPLFARAELRCRQHRLPGRLQTLCRPGGLVPFYRPAGLSLCLPAAPLHCVHAISMWETSHTTLGHAITSCWLPLSKAAVHTIKYSQMIKRKSFHFPKYWGLGIQYSILVGRTQFYPLPPFMYFMLRLIFNAIIVIAELCYRFPST